MAVVPGSGWVAWRSIPGLSARGWFLLGSGWLFLARGGFSGWRLALLGAWCGSARFWCGVVGLRAVGSLPVPRRGLIEGVRVILVWLLVGGWRVVVGGGARKLGVGWWCSPGWLLDGWLSLVRATVALRLRWLAVFPVWWWGACSRLAVLRLVVVGSWLFDVSRCGLLLAGSGCWYFLARGSCCRLMVRRGSGVWWGGWHYPAWAGLQGWAHGCCSMFPGVLDSVAGWRGALRFRWLAVLSRCGWWFWRGRAVWLSKRFYSCGCVLVGVKRSGGVCIYAGQSVFGCWVVVVFVVGVAFVLVRAFFVGVFLDGLGWVCVRETIWARFCVWCLVVLGFGCAIIYR